MRLRHLVKGRLIVRLVGAGVKGGEFLADVGHLRAVIMVDVALAEFGAIHIACNNAGVFTGGLLWEAVRVSDEFLEEGTIVSTRGRDEVVLNEEHAVRAGTRPNWPIVVLVDYYSASAAEIVAAALQDNHRAIIAGTRTWGKGSVQNIIELPDGSALKLTVARYYTPSGASIQARGIEPDVRIEQLTPEQAATLAREEPALSEAMLEGHLEATGADRRIQAARDAARRRATSEDLASFTDDYQARMAHQVLRAMAQEGESAR